MKTQAKVALGIVVLLVAGLLGYFLAVKGDDADQEKAIDRAGAPQVVSAADAKAASDAGVDGIILSWAGPDAVVTEFMDFECPGCRAQTVLMDELLTKYKGKVTIAVRPLPLTNIHQNAVPAWLAALAANEQGKFGEMYKQIFATQDDWAGSSDGAKTFRGYAEDLGLDMAKYDAAVASPENQKILADSVEAATEVGATGTPTWVLNNSVLELNSEQDLFDAVDSAIATAGA